MLDEVKVRERKSAKHGKTYEYRFEIAQVGGERKWISSYDNGELKIKSTFLPAGFGDFYCPACGEVIASMNDDRLFT